jgi:hypothetical protein
LVGLLDMIAEWSEPSLRVDH